MINRNHKLMNKYQDGGEKSQVDEQIQQNDEQKPQVDKQVSG